MQKKGFFPFGRFWKFQAKRIRICPILGIFEVTGQKSKELSRLCGFWTFRAKRIRICPILWLLDVTDQKNKDLSHFWGFWTFEAKRKRIYPVWGEFKRFGPKE